MIRLKRGMLPLLAVALVGLSAGPSSAQGPSVTVTESGGSTNVAEAGATDTYTIVLNTVPTANVQISINSGTQLNTAPTVLTFTPANWNVAQTVTVTAFDDAAVEGPHTGTITHAASSGDAAYQGIAIASVTANITDNDAGGGAGVTITQSGGSTTVAEGGATDTYTLVLNTPPTANVTITINPGTQVTVAPATLTFTPANWNTAQTVTVTAVADGVAEGPHTGTITHTSASADAAYNAVPIANVVANITDTGPSVTITQSGGSTDVGEGAAGNPTDTYTIVLNTPPTANVQININSGAQLNTAPTFVIFTPANWNTPQTVTVTAFDDAAVEGPHTGTITHAASSGDAAYQGIAVPSVTANITDNDGPAIGVTITQSAGSTNVTEGGATDTYTAVLNTVPTANVTITINPGTQVTVAPATLTFTPANWNTAQTVTVTAVDDAAVEGAHTGTITHTSASTDAAYNAIPIAGVTANITDNDAGAGVLVVQSGGSTDVAEGGITDTYTLVLNTAPTANVTITIAPGTQVTVAPATLTFTAANWNTAQTVTVTAVDDAAVEGAHTGTITHTSASADAAYNAIVLAGVTVNITDNDGPGVTVTQSGGTTTVTEGGATDTYTVVLNSAPTANVTITINPGTQVTAAPATLTFTPANWNTAQTVTVTAVDDAAVEGAHTGTITHTSASTDAGYNALTIASVTVNITDNDGGGGGTGGGGEGSFGGSGGGTSGGEGGFGFGRSQQVPGVSPSSVLRGPFLERGGHVTVFNVSQRSKKFAHQAEAESSPSLITPVSGVLTLFVGLGVLLAVKKAALFLR